MNDLMLDFEKSGGLIPAIIQDAETGEILMQAYWNAEAYEKTVAMGEVYFYSRSREQLWRKGETSGNILKVSEILTDCDTDSVLIKIKHDPDLRACHTGERTCFHKKIK